MKRSHANKVLVLSLWYFASTAVWAECPESCQSTGNGAVARRVAARATSAVQFDFDRDGYSDIVLAKTSEEETEFQITRSSDGTTTSTKLESGRPVPGDYDGDSFADLAVVSKKKGRLHWQIIRSSDGQTVTQVLGDSDDTVIYGCRFLTSGKSSLAVLRGGKLLAQGIDDKDPTVIGTIPKKNAEIIGCGDVFGDGTDEPILRTDSRVPGLDALGTLGCKNQVLLYRTIKSFSSGGILRLDSVDFPLIVALRTVANGNLIVALQGISEIFPYPKFYVPKRTAFSSGFFKIPGAAEGSDSTSYGLLMQDPQTREVTRRLFDVLPARPESVLTAPEGFRLVKTQEIYR